MHEEEWIVDGLEGEGVSSLPLFLIERSFLSNHCGPIDSVLEEERDARLLADGSEGQSVSCLPSCTLGFPISRPWGLETPTLLNAI